MPTKNITLKIDQETYRKARIHAANEGTSVSALVREYLKSLTHDSENSPHQQIVATLQEIYAEADASATPRTGPLTPLTRDQIYAERIR